MPKKIPTVDMKKLATLSRKIWKEREKQLRSHRLYVGAKQWFFMRRTRGSLAEVPRQPFEKTHSRTVLLGGSLAGKAIARIVPRNGFMAWKKAFEAKDIWQKAGFDYVPVEPILRAKKTKSGEYRVIAGVLQTNLEDFLLGEKGKKSAKMLARQKEKIKQVMRSLGIVNQHFEHNSDYCVEMHEGKPRLYAIDFDLARCA